MLSSLLFFTDYLDTVFGGPSLWPTDPYKKAVDQLLLEDFGSKVRNATVNSSSYMCIFCTL